MVKESKTILWKYRERLQEQAPNKCRGLSNEEKGERKAEENWENIRKTIVKQKKFHCNSSLIVNFFFLFVYIVIVESNNFEIRWNRDWKIKVPLF